ncbi:MAG: hypothetical protein J6S24_04130 [Lentisphaeria bacterium]|nr:hypothetical protein [Lentisphaeria bacterium]
MATTSDLVRKVADQKNDPGLHGAPFWAWNGKLDKDELIRQIHVMKDMGLGGFFMHSRVGLNTPYLSEEWFDCVKACISEAEKLGMNAWLYDEDRWPSGAAGGLVTKDHRYRMRALVMLGEGEELSGLEPLELGKFAVRFAPGSRHYLSYRKLSGNERAGEGEKEFRFIRFVSGDNSWYNGESYLDTLNPEAVDKFIEVTHEAYRREIADKFGKAVPGIFTDEPNYSQVSGIDGDRVQWTDALPEKFEERFGYSILDKLPELFMFSCEERFSKVRHDFYDLCAELFTRAFGERIGKWCQENNMLYTGHLLQEAGIEIQTRCVGECMRFYEYMQAPGMDLLTEYRDEYMTAKQVTSVAHQFGWKVRLSETYGCTGWDFPFFGHKALGDWQLALGINLRCQHLAWYTSAAQAKRDYPASISYQSPWADRHVQLEDYFGRISAVLNEGEETRDILLLHPVESFWGVALFNDYNTDYPNVGSGKECQIDPLQESKKFGPLHNKLLMEHLDFDLGCEDIMSRHGKVADGKLSINLASYKAVLVPRMLTIRSTTLELLDKFHAAGGVVVCVGNAPERVDAERSDRAKEIFSKFICCSDDAAAVKALGESVRRVSISSQGEEICSMFHSIHTSDDFQSLFICNYGKSLKWTEYTDRNPAPGTVLKGEEMQMVRRNKRTYPETVIKWSIPAGYGVYELDTATGKWYKVPFETVDGAAVFKTGFEPLQSRMYVASGSVISAELPAETNRTFVSGKPLVAAGTSLKYKLSEKNMLVLDKPEYSVNGDAWQGAEYVLLLDDKLRQMIGAAPRGGSMVQPWCNSSRRKTGEMQLKLRYNINVKDIPASGVEFALENPELYTVTFNGKVVDKSDTGWWCDLAIRKMHIPGELFVAGANTLELECSYSNLLPGLEMCYLIGDFGVENDTLTTLPETLEIGDWCKQRLPNYAGNLDYIIPLENASGVIELGEWRGVAVEYSINGSAFKLLAWPPYTIDLGETPVSGTLTLRILGHRRNAMGPFYLAERPYWTGPAQFKMYETEERQLVKCGLLETPMIRK